MRYRVHGPDRIDGDAATSQYPELTKRHLRHLRETGQIGYYVIRGRAWYDRCEIEEFLASRRIVRRPR